MSSPALEYTVRESSKARHIRLKVSVQRGLEVIVPKGFSHSRVPPLLEKKRRWIRSARRRMQQHAKFFHPEPSGQLPDHILLRAIGETWRVDYRETKEQSVGVHVLTQCRLLVRGKIQSRESCKAALRRWLARRCHEALVSMLREVSRETKLPFGKAMVKSQRTRWASCSKHKTISLNARLLFLPSELVRYVFIHELCHTVHMNHSTNFWELLRHHDAGCSQHDQQLRKAWRYIPEWSRTHRPTR